MKQAKGGGTKWQRAEGADDDDRDDEGGGTDGGEGAGGGECEEGDVDESEKK